MPIKKDISGKTRIRVEDFSQGLYQFALGAAAKIQQELLGQSALDQHRQHIESATLGLLASALWLVKYIADQTYRNRDFYYRCQQVLEEKFCEQIDKASDGQCDHKELIDYLNKLHSIYDKAWSNNSEPGRTWWLAQAMAKEILDTDDPPELAIVILVGEIESTLAMGVRLVRSYIIY
ncbi:MAG: hypothetical protein AB1489_20750 [Acidobacteriota bacterium]